MTDADILREERLGTVARLVLNRPAARNSLSLAVMERLHAAILRLGTDPGVHVVLIAGTGPVFCAGHDLKEITAARAGPDGGHRFFQRTMAACVQVMEAIVACPKPVIAVVHGTATAAGCQLVASCDLAVAADDARFATPGVNIGLFCSTPMVALSRNVPRKAAMEMLLTGDAIPATDALRLGLVNRVVPPSDLDATALSLARQIAAKAPAVLRIGKVAFHRQSEMPLSDAYAYTAKVMVANMMAPDAEEGIAAFLQKRPPRWQDG